MRRLFQIAILAAGLDCLKDADPERGAIAVGGSDRGVSAFPKFSHGVELRGDFRAICP